LYGLALVAREAEGTLAIRRPATPGPLGAAVGLLVGALAECLSGAPGGRAETPPGRGLLAAVGELSRLGLGADIVEETCRAMSPGAAAAVVAEVDEHWHTPVDTRMAALGGIMIRRYRADIVDPQVRQEVEILEAELRELDQECDLVAGPGSKAIRERARATRARLTAAAARAEAMVARLQEETEARLEVLLAQMNRAEPEVEARIDIEAKIGQAIAQMRAATERRTAALMRAVALAREALGSNGPN
jgi:hypothetical protein